MSICFPTIDSVAYNMARMFLIWYDRRELLPQKSTFYERLTVHIYCPTYMHGDILMIQLSDISTQSK